MHLIEKTMEFQTCQRLNWTIGNYHISKNVHDLDSINAKCVLDVIVLDSNISFF